MISPKYFCVALLALSAFSCHPHLNLPVATHEQVPPTKTTTTTTPTQDSNSDRPNPEMLGECLARNQGADAACRGVHNEQDVSMVSECLAQNPGAGPACEGVRTPEDVSQVNECLTLNQNDLVNCTGVKTDPDFKTRMHHGRQRVVRDLPNDFSAEMQSSCNLELSPDQVGQDKSQVTPAAAQALAAKGYITKNFATDELPSGHTLSIASSCSKGMFSNSCTYSVQIGTYEVGSISFGNSSSGSTVERAIKNLASCQR